MIKTGIVAIFIGLLLPFTSFADAPQNPLGKACDARGGAASESAACVDSQNPGNPVFGSGGIINKVANGVALVAGTIAVIYIMLGGFRMITSTGDAQAFKEARSTLIYGAVGLIVVTFARAIVGFVLGRLE